MGKFIIKKVWANVYEESISPYMKIFNQEAEAKATIGTFQNGKMINKVIEGYIVVDSEGISPNEYYGTKEVFADFYYNESHAQNDINLYYKNSICCFLKSIIEGMEQEYKEHLEITFENTPLYLDDLRSLLQDIEDYVTL